MMNSYRLPIRPKPPVVNLKYILLLAIVVLVLFGAQKEQLVFEVTRALKIMESIGLTTFEITGYSFYVCIITFEHLFSSSRVENQGAHKKPIFIKPNYANIFGGATILMKTKSCNGMNNILSEDNDKYMYTFTTTPIEFVIGLKEQIAIESITIKSRQMYSSIVKSFKVEGSFTFPDASWTELGTFRAANNFNEQEFIVNRKVLRYVKITINSVYGGWSYFTLTRVSVYGQSIFAHAVKNTVEEPANPSQQEDSEQNNTITIDKDDDSCSSDPVTILSSNSTPSEEQQLMENNVIVSLHQKIKTLQQQSKTMDTSFAMMMKQYQRMQKKLEKLIESNFEQEEEISNEEKRVLANSEKNLWLFKDVILEAAGLFFVGIVCTIFIIHLYNYCRQSQITSLDQKKTQTLKPIIKRGLSKMKTLKVDTKSYKHIRLNLTQETRQSPPASLPKSPLKTPQKSPKKSPLNGQRKSPRSSPKKSPRSPRVSLDKTVCQTNEIQ